MFCADNHGSQGDPDTLTVLYFPDREIRFAGLCGILVHSAQVGGEEQTGVHSNEAT